VRDRKSGFPASAANQSERSSRHRLATRKHRNPNSRIGFKTVIGDSEKVISFYLEIEPFVAA
jgi:hypothetical protein